VEASSHIEPGGQAQESRRQGSNQIVENTVGYRFVVSTLIAVRPDIFLKGLQLHASLVRYVLEDQHSKIRLAGLGTQTGELGDPDPNAIIF
jgi:hypothetical protein